MSSTSYPIKMISTKNTLGLEFVGNNFWTEIQEQFCGQCTNLKDLQYHRALCVGILNQFKLHLNKFYEERD